MKKPYNELCDVYSLGVLIWEMMALSKPYDEISMVDLINDVWKDDDTAKRPSPSVVVKGRFLAGRRRRMIRGMRKTSRQSPGPLGSPESLQSLLAACWSRQLKDRPSMKQVECRLKDEITAFEAVHGRSGRSRE